MEQTACSIVYSTRLAIYLYLQIDGKDYSNLVLINMLHNISNQRHADRMLSCTVHAPRECLTLHARALKLSTRGTRDSH